MTGNMCKGLWFKENEGKRRMGTIKKESNCMSCAYKLGAWKVFQRGEKPGRCKPECLMEREEFGQLFGCSDYIRRVEPEE